MIFKLNDIQVRRLSFMGGLRLRQLWPVNMKSCCPDALEGLKRRKDKGSIVSVEDDALKRLLELPDRRTFAGLRDYTLILLTLDSSIRPGEALSLIPPYINLRAREVYVRAKVAKTRTRRIMPLNLKPNIVITQQIVVQKSLLIRYNLLQHMSGFC